MADKSSRLSESDIQTLILAWLLTQKFFVWRNKSEGTFDPLTGKRRAMNQVGAKKGVPDILGILPDGRFLAIEVKTQTGKVSAEQGDFIRQANTLGGLALVARSLDDVKAHLEDYTHGRRDSEGRVPQGPP